MRLTFNRHAGEWEASMRSASKSQSDDAPSFCGVVNKNNIAILSATSARTLADAPAPVNACAPAGHLPAGAVAGLVSQRRFEFPSPQ